MAVSLPQTCPSPIAKSATISTVRRMRGAGLGPVSPIHLPQEIPNITNLLIELAREIIGLFVSPLYYYPYFSMSGAREKE
jgi:hypothetical protein